LTRANSQLDAFVLEFRKREIPYQLIGNRGLYDQDEIKDVVAILKVVVNPFDATSLYRVLNVEAFAIEPTLIAKILGTTKQKRSISMYDICLEQLATTKDARLGFVFDNIAEFQKQITKKGP